MKKCIKVSDNVKQALILLAKEQKLKVCKRYEEDRGEFSIFTIDTEPSDGIHVFGMRWNKEDEELISLPEMTKFILETTPAIVVNLNEQYEAIVDKKTKTIKVGCQTIPFSAVEELMKEITK